MNIKQFKFKHTKNFDVYRANNFFNSKIIDSTFIKKGNNYYFIVSSKYPGNTKTMYTIKRGNSNGWIENESLFMEYSTLTSAKKALKDIVK